MLRLLAVALVICAAFVATAFVGSVLQQRAQDLRALQERDSPAVAATPPSLVLETRD